MAHRSMHVIALALCGALAFGGALAPGWANAEEPISAQEGAPDPVERISWPALIEEIERTSPLMFAARAGLDTFESKLNRAQWATFPTFKLEGGAAPTPTIEGSGFSVDVDWQRWGYFYRVRLSFTQPITTFGRISALRRAAHSGVEVGQAQIELARWELRYRAAQAYYGAVLAAELRAILEEGKRWITKAEDRMDRLRAEDSEEYDQMAHLRLKSRLTEFFELEAQNLSLEVGTHEGLRALLSRAPGHQVRPVESALEPLRWVGGEPAEYVERAITHRPEMRMARAGRDAKRALADAKSAELWPSVVIVGDTRINDSDVIGRESTILGPETLGFSAGLLLAMQWQLDVPNRMFLRDEARAEARKADAQVQVQADLTSVRIHQLVQDLKNKSNLILAYRKANKAAQGWLSASWDLYDSGFGSFQEVMDALVQFYGRKVGYLRTVHEHNLLVHELSRAIGEDISLPETEQNKGDGADDDPRK